MSNSVISKFKNVIGNWKLVIGNSKSGFTILYSVLVATVLLSIGVSIYNISSKQYILSSSSIDSQIAVYMADAGVECALYFDGKDAFTSPAVVGTGGIDCNGFQDVDIPNTPASPAVSSFQIRMLGVNPPCAKVSITKTSEIGPTPHIKTKIESRGYNYCPDLNNPRTVERALQVTYPVF